MDLKELARKVAWGVAGLLVLGTVGALVLADAVA